MDRTGTMRGMFRQAASFVAAMLACAAIAAQAQQEIDSPPDPWIHAATGTPFPAEIGEFRRGSVRLYSQDGRDASTGYSLRRGDDWVTVTIYVYPAIKGMDCPAIFAGAKRSIETYGAAVLLSEARMPPPSGRGPRSAYHASYSLPAGAMRQSAPATRSEVYLHCPTDGAWLVKYRATSTTGVDFSNDVAALVGAIRWPAELAD